jgi:membrane-bound ClpP family serine protease
MEDEVFGSSEMALAFIIVGILLFIIEVFQPGFLIAVPGTVFIVLGILMSFDDVFGLSPFTLLIIGLIVGLGSLYGTMKMYQSLAPPDTPSEMSIENTIGKSAIVTKDVVANEMFGKAKVGREEFRATAEADIASGTKVKVTHAEGITLTVVPE